MTNDNIECNRYDIPTGGCWDGISVNKKRVGFEKGDHKSHPVEKPPLGKTRNCEDVI